MKWPVLLPCVVVLFLGLLMMEGCRNGEQPTPETPDSLNFEVAIDTFAARNGIDPSAIVQESDISYHVINPNPAGTAAAGQILSVYYEVWVLNGDLLDRHDSTEGDPIRVRQGANAIYPLGADLALGLMEEGAEYGFFIPEDQAFGDYSLDPILPANSHLYFEVTLDRVETDQEISDLEQAEINQYIIDKELNDTVKVPFNRVERLGQLMDVAFKRLTKDTVNMQPFPGIGDSVAVEYTLFLTDSTEAYSTREASLELRGSGNPVRFAFGETEVLPGLELGVGNMRLNERARILIPSSQGYQGSAYVFPRSQDMIKDFIDMKILPPYVLVVPPFRVLVFEARLAQIKPN